MKTGTIKVVVDVDYIYDENHYMIKHNGNKFVENIAMQLAINSNLNTVDCGVQLTHVSVTNNEN